MGEEPSTDPRVSDTGTIRVGLSRIGVGAAWRGQTLTAMV
jgi:hypothetical protein